MNNYIESSQESQSVVSEPRLNISAPPESSSFKPQDPNPKPLLSKSIVIFLIIALAVILSLGTYLILSSQQDQQIPQTDILPSLSPTPTPDETANWETYRNDEFGFLFLYPENRFPYFSKEIDPGEQLYLFIAPAAELESLRLTDIWISLLVLLYSADITLDEYLNPGGDPEYYKGAKREPIDIGGEQGYKLTKYARMGQEETFSYVAQVKKGSYVYKLELETFLEETFLANEALFNQILSTFKFIDENEISWESAVELIRGCQVTMVAQTHSRDVDLVLKDGTVRNTIEHAIDMVLEEAEIASGKCGFYIEMETE